MDVPVCECFGGGGGGREGRGSYNSSVCEDEEDEEGAASGPRAANKREILRLVALLKRSSGGRALFMTLNVNMNVENSIKNIYVSADSAAVQVFAVKAHFSFYFASMTAVAPKHLYCPLVAMFLFFFCFFHLHLPVSNSESENK